MARPCNFTWYLIAPLYSMSKKNLVELRKDLEEKHMSSEGYEKDVKVSAQSTGIDWHRDVVACVDELDCGYVDKPKGILQVTWECSFFIKRMLKDGRISVEGLQQNCKGDVIKQMPEIHMSSCITVSSRRTPERADIGLEFRLTWVLCVHELAVVTISA